MTLKSSLRKRLAQPVQQFDRSFSLVVEDTLRAPVDARIGNPDGVTVWYDKQAQLAYIHGLGEVTGGTLYASTVRSGLKPSEVKWGLPVRVKRENGGYVVVSKAEQAAKYEASIPEEALEELIAWWRITYGTMQLAEGLQVVIWPAWYGNEYVSTLYSADFTASPTDTSGATISRPTSNGRALAVLIQLDAATATLSYKQSSEFNKALSLATAAKQGLLPDVDSDKYRIGYIKLTKGLTQFRREHLFQAPELFSKGGTGGFPITVTSSQTIASNTQVVTGAFSVTTGSVSVAGRLKVIA